MLHCSDKSSMCICETNTHIPSHQDAHSEGGFRTLVENMFTFLTIFYN